MKIKVELDAGYVFDMLAILKVKNEMNGDMKSILNLLEFEEGVYTQISIERFNKILNSGEFQDLYYKNLEIFCAVDKAKLDEIKASQVDRLNYDRWVLKNKLQEKFFGEKTTEQKIGYGES